MEELDSINVYCRMLGHHIPFQYCRTAKDGFPCARILDCHHERLPITQFIETHYSATEQAQIFSPPVPKMTSIMELIQQAKNRSQ